MSSSFNPLGHKNEKKKVHTSLIVGVWGIQGKMHVVVSPASVNLINEGNPKWGNFDSPNVLIYQAHDEEIFW